jgi:hypothetical protein
VDEKAEKMDQDKPKFDWVTERSACSLPKVFQQLRLQVEEDIKTRNGLRPQNAPYEFSVEENGEEFRALLEAKEVQRSVTFSLGEHAISVRGDQTDLKIDVKLNFTEKGECKLNVEGKEYDFWQVRRMALEDLLFRGY